MAGEGDRSRPPTGPGRNTGRKTLALPPVIAYFITPHGFGHASRAAAVMAATSNLITGIRFELFTTCPQWIFEESLETQFGYHPVPTDIGLVQTSPLSEDLPATCRQLNRMLPFDKSVVKGLASEILKLNCRLVICDIAPLGITVARAAGVPSVLVENFTWDWIYSGYLEAEPGLKPHIDYLAEIFRQAHSNQPIVQICGWQHEGGPHQPQGAVDPVPGTRPAGHERNG